MQTLKAIDSLRKQFFFLLKDAGLVDHNTENCNTWSHDEHLVRAVICAGLFPGICSVMVSCYAFLVMFVYFSSSNFLYSHEKKLFVVIASFTLCTIYKERSDMLK